MYETMVGWETDPTLAEQSPQMQDFAQIWQAADKIVYSKMLEAVSTARTRIERDFAPEAIRRMKTEAERDLIVGGPVLAAQAFEAGLVDECHLRVHELARECGVEIGASVEGYRRSRESSAGLVE
jgi:dihydrofolate reductase